MYYEKVDLPRTDGPRCHAIGKPRRSARATIKPDTICLIRAGAWVQARWAIGAGYDLMAVLGQGERRSSRGPHLEIYHSHYQMLNG